MKRAVAFVCWMMLTMLSYGQIRLTKLILRPKETYELKESDILVVDTLIMMDSSRILLNKLKKENFLHVKKMIFGRECFIDGKGVQGLKGRNGRSGTSSSGPCSTGGTGSMGTEGTNGGAGINLFLSFSDIVFRGTLTIDVAGGDAGDGGTGGLGGGGGSGTRLCAGGTGGNGAAGSNGGNGGNSGNIIFNVPSIPELRTMLGERIIVRNYGGNLGSAGDGGSGGYSGLSPTGNNKLDGKPGKKGPKGKDGIAGKPGAITFQDK